MRQRALAWAGVLACGAVAGVLSLASPAAAHPLGRFTVNQYAGLRVAPNAVHVDYVVDLAELPAFQARTEQADTDGDGEVSAAEADQYARTTCTSSASLLRLTVADRPATLVVDRSAVTFPAGEGGLDTLRLECTLRAAATVTDRVAVRFRNDAYADRIGWQEVTATGDRVALTRSDVPESSVSGRLGAYPEDPLADPLAVRSATLEARPSAGAVPAAGSVLAAPRQAADRLTAAFTGVVERRDLTVGIALLGIALAMVLGAAHALAPGHGKTVMAAVLLGERGTWRQAAVIAGSVTVTHTAGVLLLGAALATSLTFAPQRLYAALGAVSGLLLALVGASLLRRALAARKHGHGHSHSHGLFGRPHSHGPELSHHPEPGREESHDQAHEQGSEPGQGGEPGQGSEAGPGSEPGRRHEGAELVHAAHGHGGNDRAEPGHGGNDRAEHGHGGNDRAEHELAEHAAHAGHGHEHEHGVTGHKHPEHDHAGHGHRGGRSHAPEPVRKRTLLTLGFAGGLLPSPSAVVVLLGAVALGRPWYGVLLVVAYGTGMAGALIGIGLAIGRWGPAIGRRLPRRFTRWQPAVPVLTSSVIMLVGITLTAQAVLTQT